MDKKLVRSWVLYDWGNSAFATTIMAAVLPIYYSEVAAKGLDSHLATSYWGYSQSIAVLIVAILAPVLGAISDYSSSKKKFLRFFAYMGMTASILLAFVGEGDYIFVSLLMIIGTIGFSGGNVFYDAFLPEIADRKEMDRVSAYGFAFGYIGGGILLAVNLLMIVKYDWFGFPDETSATRTAFVTVGLWWFIFSLPLFLKMKEEKNIQVNRNESYIQIGFKRVGNTFRSLGQYKQLLIFLLAFWMYNDGISTIIKMATIYGSEIGIGSNDLIAALLITQFVGIPCTFLFGWLSGKIHAKRLLTATLIIYTGIVILGYFMSTALHFYFLALCVGAVQGGAQALSRSIYGRMIPRNRHAEFYGFYGISSKFSAIFGPFIFALVGQLSGSSRLGIFSLIFFFIAGMVLLQFVNIEKGEKEANSIQ
ncbi:UMF1 family MFS transporter [Melghiribacillus thermohalophilus]|uniref:UMF1 family MFS transporter n=1 Tax=Melghiribacillus thermohalophilus TaxID=1324956 RepID=A0A4V2V244_9BACI|nr:MFS transporter [Melghiribacillus thermohalophilus]TCT23632.1 UMF1 family MFS transporter [Melghiribacillus thermohalophilus]